jgi:hypothetical protein
MVVRAATAPVLSASSRVEPVIGAVRKPAGIYSAVSPHLLCNKPNVGFWVRFEPTRTNGRYGASITAVTVGRKSALKLRGAFTRTARMVKIFGCRQASENRPSTNPRGCGDSLWDSCFAWLKSFRNRPGAGGDLVSEIFARQSVYRELATGHIQACCGDRGERGAREH